MAKVDFNNLGFDYIKTDYRFVLWILYDEKLCDLINDTTRNMYGKCIDTTKNIPGMR